MKISYISDLHLEMGIKNVILPGGDVLLLAGDLCQVSSIERGHGPTWHKFFSEQVAKYPKVYYVLGNHEFYQGRIETALDILETQLVSYPNVKILDNEVVELNPEWMLFGTTLWTNYNDNDKLARDTARVCMSDHHVIKQGLQGWFSPEHAYDLNQLSRSKFKSVLAQYPEKLWVVITHHTPSMLSGHPRWGGDKNPLNYAFHNTGLDEFIENSNIKFYVHGHTHDSMDYMLGQCHVLCNPKGYGNENPNFNCLKQFEI